MRMMVVTGITSGLPSGGMPVSILVETGLQSR
jgi:hypothetical protein